MRRAAVLLVSSATALIPAAAGATVVAPAGPAYDQFSLGADRAAGGRALVAWTLASPRVVVQVAERRRGGAAYGRPVTLGAGRLARASLSPRAARGVVAWLDGGRLRMAGRAGNGGWRGQALPGGLPVGQGVRVADLELWDDGAAVAAVEVRDPDRFRVVVLERARGARGAWRTGAVLDVDEAAGGQSAVDGRGGVTVVWLRLERGGASSVRASRRPFGAGRFEPAQTVVVAAPGAAFAEPQIATGAADGVAVLAGVQDGDGDIVTARVGTRRGGAAWAVSPPWPAAAVAVGGDDTWAVRAATGRRGTSVVVRRLGAGARWDRPLTVVPPGPRRVAGGPGVVVPRAGRPAVWWAAEARQGERWYAAARGARGWTGARALGVTRGAVEFGVGGGGALAALVTAPGGGRVESVELPRGR